MKNDISSWEKLSELFTSRWQPCIDFNTVDRCIYYLDYLNCSSQKKKIGKCWGLFVCLTSFWLFWLGCVCNLVISKELMTAFITIWARGEFLQDLILCLKENRFFVFSISLWNWGKLDVGDGVCHNHLSNRQKNPFYTWRREWACTRIHCLMLYMEWMSELLLLEWIVCKAAGLKYLPSV